MLTPVIDSGGNVSFVQVVEAKSSESVAAIVQRVAGCEAQVKNALSNSAEFESIPMRGLLSNTGKTFGLGRLALPLLILTIMAVSFAALSFLKTELRIKSDGTLSPEIERIIFASRDGVVSRLDTSHGDEVEKEQVLLELKSVELESEIAKLRGEIETEKKKLEAIEVVKVTLDQGSPDSQKQLGQLASEELQSAQRITNLKTDLNTLLNEQTKLVLRSPIAGSVVTTDLETRLEKRPVRQGDALIKIAATQGGWLAKIRVPDTKISHLLKTAQADRNETTALSSIPVELIVATHPTRTFTGIIRNVAETAEVEPTNQKSYIVVTVEIVQPDEESKIEFQPESSVIAKFKCGECSIGYAWFGEFIDSVKYRFF